MLAIDTSGTSETRANTGIQRVTRSLIKGLSNLTKVRPVCLNKTHNYWCFPKEKGRKRIYHQEDLLPGHRRGTSSNLWNRILATITSGSEKGAVASDFSGFIEPEIFTKRVFSALNKWLVNGIPTMAIYYDATSLKLPELSPKKNTGRFPAYLRELLNFTGIAAISETSRNELLDYWKWLGIRDHPVIETIPLAVNLSHTRRIPGHGSDKDQFPVVLCVGSIEGRKNQVSLLAAAEKLWQQGLCFQLRLIGLASPETSGPTSDQLEALQKKGRPLKWLGPRSEQDLQMQYATCRFTVYPSLAEGFGLPVLESLKHGKPCVCSSRGAIGEISTQGGCLTVEQPTPDALVDAIKTLLTEPDVHTRLSEEAMSRPFRTWSDYAKDILEFQKSLQKSSSCSQ